MKKLLLLGAVYPFCDLYDDIKSLGYETIVCDYYPDAPCKTKSKISYDISTNDVSALVGIAKKHDVAGIVTAFSDRNMMPGYELAKELALPTMYSPEIIDLITDKSKLKEFFVDHGIPINPYRRVSSDFSDKDLEGMEFPLIIKPVDGYGSKGISVCETLKDVRRSVEATTMESKDFRNSILVEEFYNVDEISANAWVKDEKSYLTCIYDVLKSAGHGFKYGNAVFPSKYTSDYMVQIKELIQEICGKLGISDGPVSLQCFIGDKGLRVSEFLYRLPGGGSFMYSPMFGGPNIGKMLAQLCAGDKVDHQNMFDFRPVSDYTFYKYKIFAEPSGSIHYKKPIEEVKKAIPEIAHISLYRENGYRFSQPLQGNEIIMQVFCKVPKNYDKDSTDLLKEIESELDVEDDNGEDILKIYYPE